MTTINNRKLLVCLLICCAFKINGIQGNCRNMLTANTSLTFDQRMMDCKSSGIINTNSLKQERILRHAKVGNYSTTVRIGEIDKTKVDYIFWKEKEYYKVNFKNKIRMARSPAKENLENSGIDENTLGKAELTNNMDQVVEDYIHPGCSVGWKVCSSCICCFLPSRLRAFCGVNVTDIPEDLPLNVTHLTFKSTGIKVIRYSTHPSLPEHNISKLYNYVELQYLSFSDNLLLEAIEPGAFNFPREKGELVHLKISGSPLLTNIPNGALANFIKLQTLTITDCGLQKPPDWFMFHPGFDAFLTEVDLSRNNITVLQKAAFSHLFVQVGVLKLENTGLQTIKNHAFANSSIREIRLRNNKKLTLVEEEAFSDSKILEILDMSYSRISHLPTLGLEKVTNLTLQGVLTLKMFPSVLQFSSIKEARLSYAHHCCAFAHPEKQNEDLWKDFYDSIASECTVSPPTTTPMSIIGGWEGTWTEGAAASTSLPQWLHQALKTSGRDIRHGSGRRLLADDTWMWDSQPSAPTAKPQIHEGSWHTNTLNPNETYTSVVRCGLGIVEGLKKVHCSPTPDAFNPCEDVMGFVWLRVTVWFVVICALLGNLVVLIVTIASHCKHSVTKFLMCNLALADLLLGVYLLMLASFDLLSIGSYFTYAITWQYDGGCQLAGFLAIFSTNLSVFTLTVITMERWYAISHAIDLSKRLRIRPAACIMLTIWVYAVIMAALPLCGVSSYSKTSICLPMEINNNIDRFYAWFLILSNSLAFIVICACYIHMFRQVRRNSSPAGNNDANIAKRMALLVFTDFICLFPIAFFGVTAAAGYPLITVSHSKILLVFFFPFNSCCNPFLYAIFTKQFHKDLFSILNTCGVCERKVAKYRATFISNPNSMSNTRNNSVHNHLNHMIHHRPSDGSVLTTFCEHSGSRASLTSPKPTPHGTPNSSARKVVEVTSAINGCHKSPVHVTNSKDSRKLSVVREASHVSNEDMTEIRLELNLALDLNPYFDKNGCHEGGSNIRSVSQYAVVGVPPQSSIDSVDPGSVCTTKYSTVTCMSDIADSPDSSQEADCDQTCHRTAVLEPLLSHNSIPEAEEDSDTNHEAANNEECNDEEY